jgi:hypothetical protein
MLPRRALMNDKMVLAQGENLSLVNVKGSKLNALSVYGKSMQDGTPSPDNPVPIVSAGDSGEINVAVSGKNLIPFPYLSPLGGAGTVYEVDGVTYTVQADGGIKCVGTPTNTFGPKLCNIRFSDLQINAQSGSGTNGEMTLSGGPLFYDANNNSTFVYWALYINTPVDMTIYPQLEYGTVATAYEPYKTPQTLTLSTPGGLPGIPVTSGGNYTDESGQQWVCDEVDLKRGKCVHRVGKTVVDGTEIKFTANSTGLYWNLPQHSAEGAIYLRPIMSMYFPHGVFSVNDKYDFLFTMPESIGSYFSSVNDLNEFCTEKSAEGQPLEFYYGINPIETDLTAEEIAAYKALHTYSPTTTVSNDADAWMKVGYREYRM